MKKVFCIFLMAMCAITFVNGATSANVDCGNSAKITATPATGWHFVKWNDNNTENPRIITPTEDVSYTAIFAINQYSVVFQNWNGAELQKETLDYGAAIVYKGETPTKAATAQYTYTFVGWSPNIPNPAVATQDWTFVAQFDATINSYTITFKNYDGTILQSSNWEYGQTPIYSGATPVKPADAEYTYTFTGWDKIISSVTGETIYIAQFTNSTNTYTITVNGDNGTTTGGGTYQYGQNITITATPNSCYTFVKWSDGDTNATRTVSVNGSTTYTAIFEKIQYTVTVQPDDVSHGSVEVTIVEP